MAGLSPGSAGRKKRAKSTESLARVISAVFVSYRSAPLAARAVDSFRQDAERAGLAPEVVVVVNSGDEGEAAALSRVADRVLLPGENLGYAGGLNAGIAASHGDPVVLAHPDLVFLPGSVAALAGAVARGGLAVAGPALFWDDAATLLLPPVEEPRPAELVRRALALDPARNGLPFRREVRRPLARDAAVFEGRRVEVSGLSGSPMVTATYVSNGTFHSIRDSAAAPAAAPAWCARVRATAETLHGRIARPRPPNEPPQGGATPPGRCGGRGPPGGRGIVARNASTSARLFSASAFRPRRVRLRALAAWPSARSFGSLTFSRSAPSASASASWWRPRSAASRARNRRAPTRSSAVRPAFAPSAARRRASPTSPR